MSDVEISPSSWDTQTAHGTAAGVAWSAQRCTKYNIYVHVLTIHRYFLLLAYYCLNYFTF